MLDNHDKKKSTTAYSYIIVLGSINFASCTMSTTVSLIPSMEYCISCTMMKPHFKGKTTTALRVQYPYTLKNHSTTTTCTHTIFPTSHTGTGTVILIELTVYIEVE